MDHFFKRNIEFHFVRSEHAYVPPQLRTHQIVQTMDSHGRERRLRAYSLLHYRQWAESVGQPIDEAIHPALTAEAGRWAPLTLRRLYETSSEIDQVLEHFGAGTDETAPNVKKYQKKRKARSGRDNDEVVSADENSVSKKARRYDSAVQIRGRPRKYIHVVDEDGKVQRNVIGSVYPHPDLEPIYIWIKKANKLAPAPKGYPGVGPPPKLGKEELSKCRTPQSFAKYDRNTDAKAVKAYRAKETGTKKVKNNGKGKTKATGGDRKAAEIDELDDSDPEDAPSVPLETPMTEEAEDATAAEAVGDTDVSGGTSLPDKPTMLEQPQKSREEGLERVPSLLHPL